MTKTSIQTVAELSEHYATGHRDFAGVELGAVNLQGADLKGINLSYADLVGADLTDCNLRGADLSYANLSEANLTNADLRGAMLIGTNLRMAVLENAILDRADYDPESTQFPEEFDPEKANMQADRGEETEDER